MTRTIRYAFILLILILLSGCNFPTASTPTKVEVDEGAIRTSVAETLAAQISEVDEEPSVEPPAPPQDTDTPPPAPEEPTWTDSAPPTETPTYTPSITPSLTPSLTSLVPRVSVSLDTNCRIGPGAGYDKIGVLMVGESAVIVAQEQTGNYWIIENPDKSGTCWLWAQYATVSGNVSGLPLLTPPPSPTPTPSETPALAYKVNYDSHHDCAGTEHLIFKVVNSGSIVLESVDIAVAEIATLASLFEGHTDVPFNGAAAGCSPMSQHYLAPSGTGYVAVPVMGVLNSGAHAAAFTFCSADTLGGLCMTKEINFNVP